MQALARGCGRAGGPLRELCAARVGLLERDASLRGALAALRRARGGGSAAWWEHVGADGEAVVGEAGHALRVKMSEYLCLVAHVEALSAAAPGAAAEPRARAEPLREAAGLREDLRVVLAALEGHGAVAALTGAGGSAGATGAGPPEEVP
ncbi:unnamed protein product, partial [Prorocentrum cordatum]